MVFPGTRARHNRDNTKKLQIFCYTLTTCQQLILLGSWAKEFEGIASLRDVTNFPRAKTEKKNVP